jgi:hypothetical protein
VVITIASLGWLDGGDRKFLTPMEKGAMVVAWKMLLSDIRLLAELPEQITGLLMF